MSAHTVGRLTAEDGGFVVNSDGRCIAATECGEKEGDARRLAACWNACEHVSTDLVERLAAKGGVAAAGEGAERIVAERDQLRAELAEARSLLDQVLDCHDCDQLEYIESNGHTEPTPRFAGVVQMIRVLLKPSVDAFRATLKRVPLEAIAACAQQLIDQADGAGVVLTIAQRPRQPLAMGNYDTVVEVRESRAVYQARERAEREGKC